MAPHPQGFTDQFGSDMHGVELDYRPKFKVIRAAESCYVATTDPEIMNMLRQPPLRPILVLEFGYYTEMRVSHQPW